MKAPDQQHFLMREQTAHLFRQLLVNRKRSWQFNQTPLFLEFLQGRIHLDCTPWGNPTYNVFGWQRPCYLLQEGSCATFQELLDTTDWSQYGPRSGNANCRDCMVHCGFEPSAVEATFSWRGLWRTVCAGKGSYSRRGAQTQRSEEEDPKSSDMVSPAPPRLRGRTRGRTATDHTLVQLESASGTTLEPQSESR